MIEILKKITNLLKKLNEQSAKPATSDAEIMEFDVILHNFIEQWKNFVHYLAKHEIDNPNDVKAINKLFYEIAFNLQEAEWTLDKLNDLRREISRGYQPPDPDAALAYTVHLANTPLKLAKMEAEMEPLEHLKVKEETFNCICMWIFVHLSQGFLTNNNGSELIVFNLDLTIRKKIPLPSPFYFDPWSICKKFNADEVIFFGEEHEYVLYVNVETSTCTFIGNKKFPVPELWPERTYYWKGDNLIIHDDNVFYRINPYENVLQQLDTSYVKATMPDFYEYYLDSLRYETRMTYRGINRVYPENYAFTYHDFEKEEVGFRNSKTKITKKIRFLNEEVYDIKVYKDYFLFIEEDKIEVRKGRKKTQILPNQHHEFLAADFFETDGKLYIICLAEHVSMGLGSSIMLYRIADTFDELIRDSPKRQVA